MKAIGRLGQIVLSGLDWLGGLTQMAFTILRAGPRRPWGIDDIAAQMVHQGVRSLPIATFMSLFIGMILAWQFGYALKDFGATMALGDASSLALVRELVPTLVALTVGAKMAAGMTAELGSMKVTEQIDALRMSGVLPIDYLIVPRFIASVVMTLLLSVIGALVMYVAGGLTAKSSFGVNPNLWFDISLVRPRHLALMSIKALAYGAAIPIVAGFCGLRARGSSEGVGWATTAAVIGGSFAVIVLDFIISAAALFLYGGDL